MTITLDIPDGEQAQIIDGICAATGWTAGSGKTKAQWAKEAVVQYIKSTAKRGRVKETMAAIVASIDAVDIT